MKRYRPLSYTQKFKPTRLYAFMAAAAVTLSFSLADCAVAQSAEHYENKLRELSATIDKIQRQLISTKTSKNKLQQSLQISEQEIGEYTKKIKGIQEALSREKKN